MATAHGRRKTTKILLGIVIVLALCGLIFSGWQLIRLRQMQQAQQQLNEQLLQTTDTTAGSESTEAWYAAYARTPDKLINFAALQQKNPDIIGWICVPGTVIDYPILFAAKGDSVYLTHDAEGNSSSYGAIFMESYNQADFSDPLTILYGHNMKDGSMFAALHNFVNQKFFDENRLIRIYLGSTMLEYEIIAAYTTDDTHLLAQNDFSDAETFTAYAEQIFSIRDLNAKLLPREIAAADRLLTLSTCNGIDDQRFFVQGILKRHD